MKQKNILISPIFYMGNKKKTIKNGLIDLFPNNINCFIDIFSGSGIVSMNTKAEKYFINDNDKYLYSLYKLFKNKTFEEIVNHINNRINEFGLARERTSHKTFEDNRKEIYKKSYYNFREYYNKNKNILDFYTLMYYSFSQQFRFNNKGDFNMPCGNDCFSDKNIEYIKNGVEFFNNKNVNIFNMDFRLIPLDTINQDDFVYLDPPYYNTTATYNENNGWNEKDENNLYEVCEQLNNKHIKFGMSNVFENKEIINHKLIDWCNKNNFNVHTFDKVSYSACGKGNSNAKEVFITNY